MFTSSHFPLPAPIPPAPISEIVQARWAQLPRTREQLHAQSDYKHIAVQLEQITRSASVIPWTHYYQCLNTACNNLPLSDPNRCVRYIAVDFDQDASKYLHSVFTCAPEGDRVLPRVGNLYNLLHVLISYV